MSGNGGQNIARAKAVVIGDNTVVHLHHDPSGSGQQPTPPDPNRPGSGALSANSGDDEVAVVNKVSALLKNDYSNSLAMANQNPLKIKQTPLKDFFVNPHIKHVDSCCTPSGGGSVLMHEVFNPTGASTSPNRVLLYGDAGIGKTISSQKFAYDWATSADSLAREFFDHFKVVVFLKLRKVQGNLEEIFEREVFCQRLTEAEKCKFFSYMKKSPREFLFLLDGASECALENLNGIRDMLMDRGNRGAYVIATDCPKLTTDWLEMSKTFYSRFSMNGYSEADVFELVRLYFNQNGHQNEQRRDALIEYLNNCEDLKQLCQIPLFILVVCELCGKSRSDEELASLTQFLGRYIQFVFDLFKQKFRVDLSSQDVLSGLGKLAILEITHSKTDFTEADLKNCKVECKVGLLNADPKEETYKFPHERIQQYVAALWLVENWALKGKDVEEARNVLERMFDDLENTKRSCCPVLVFIAGLLAQRNDVETLMDFLRRLSTRKIEGKLRNLIRESCFGKTMDLLLACVNEAWRNEGSSMNERILGLFEGFMPFTGTDGVYGLTLSCGAARGLARLVNGLRVTKLNLSRIIVTNTQAKFIASKCFGSYSCLTSVKFSHSCLTPDAVQAVCLALAPVLTLAEVDLSCCNFGEEGLQAIANLIENGQHAITSLQLADTLDEQGKQRKMVKHDSREESWANINNLTKFHEDLASSTLSDDAILCLIRALKSHNELNDVSLPANCVASFTQQWLEVFEQNGELKRIKLHLKVLDENLQEQLVALANNMTQLEKMSLVLEDEASHRPEFSTHSSLPERTGGKIKLHVRDHTHSVRDPANVLASPFPTG